MSVDLLNFIETVLNGLMSGVMYSLVALGFVLIFKASGVFNFAQGVFALFAALTLVGYQTGQVPFAHLINELFGTNYHNWYASMPNFLSYYLNYDHHDCSCVDYRTASAETSCKPRSYNIIYGYNWLGFRT